MTLAHNADQLVRTQEIARLLLRYGRSDMLAAARQDPLLADVEPVSPQAGEEAEQLSRDLEALGPTFIKLGQLLSTRSDLLPPPYLEALSRLQDEVEPFPFDEVERIVAEELGVRLSKAFTDFEATPTASASLGQVHRATLRDGRMVAVKVQRPDIRPRVLADLEALDRLAHFAEEHSEGARRYRLTTLLEEFHRTLLAELDYRREAQNLRTLGRSLERFDHLTVPQPIDDYSSSRVLTMEYVVGVKVDEVSPLARLELDGTAIADELFEAYLVQVLVDGLFHADPHPGNLLLTDDGRLALIDLGMVGLVAPGLQDHLLKLLIALGEGKSDEVVERSLAMSETTSDSDLERFRRELNHRVLVLHGAAVEDVEVGRVILDLAGLAADCGVRVPQELSLLGKALLSLDHIACRLDPEFDANAAIRRHAGQLMSRRVRRDMSPGNLIAGLLEAKELAEQLPSRVNKILAVLADNQLRLEVDAFDEVAMIRAIQKVANRIAAGTVLAALIVGAALMMRVDTAFRLFGYPGFAMLCFLAAAAGGVVLLWNVVMHDREDRRDRRRR